MKYINNTFKYTIYYVECTWHVLIIYLYYVNLWWNFFLSTMQFPNYCFLIVDRGSELFESLEGLYVQSYGVRLS